MNTDPKEKYCGICGGLPIRVVLPAASVPPVTKKTGEKEYIVRDSLVVYGEGSTERRELKALDGARFIVDESGNANAVSDNTELVATLSLEDVEMLFGEVPQ